MLTALGEETDEVLGLETGADDYVTKPFWPRELALRVRSVFAGRRGTACRVGPRTGSSPRFGRPRGSEARVGSVVLSLTLREYDLLVFLLRHPRKAFTREELLEQVWNWTFGDHSTVTVHVRRLREKMEEDPSLPRGWSRSGASVTGCEP